MPHDCNGKKIEPGDIVSVKFKVLQVFANEDACNVELESISTMPCSGSPTRVSAINTKQTIKVGSLYEEDLAGNC